MRVAQLTCVYPPYGGGIGHVAYNYARLLAASHQVTVFTPRYRKDMSVSQADGVKVQLLRPLVSLGNAAFLPQLAWQLKKFDCIHLHYPFFGVQELLAYLPQKARLVMNYHMVPQSTGIKGVFFRFGTKLVEKRLAQKANLLITPTQDYLESVALPRLGNRNKWRVLPLGVDERFSPGAPSEALRYELKIKPNVPVILFVGSLDSAHAFKGLEVLLNSLTHIKYNTWKLLIVGRGNLKPVYEKQARDLGIIKQVTFCGFVPESKLPDYFRLAKVFVLPSTSEAETFGLVLLQAMACGVPVISTRLPGVRAVVKERENGLLVQPGDALALAAALDHLLSSTAEVRELGENDTRLVEQEYRWPKIGERLLKFYNELG